MINFHINPALLFTPGNKPDLFNKAESVGANGVILNLEDGIAEKDKDVARKCVIDYLGQSKTSTILKIVRINNLNEVSGIADILALSEADILFDALIYPKSQSANEINYTSKLLEKKFPQLPIIVSIETSVGISQIDNIVIQSKNIAGLLFGPADYSSDVGCTIEPTPLLYPRMKIINAAALKHLACYDGPYFDFNDDNALINEVNHIKKLGFTGKLAIHPKQISSIIENFLPSKNEVVYAENIVATYEKSGGKISQFEGIMIDQPIYNKAKQTLEIFKKLSKKRGKK